MRFTDHLGNTYKENHVVNGDPDTYLARYATRYEEILENKEISRAINSVGKGVNPVDLALNPTHTTTKKIAKGVNSSHGIRA